MIRGPAASASALLSYYGFDLHEQALNQLVENWLGAYPARWVMAAVIEALYQGRYKAYSVDRILFLWYLRGQPLHHFDFEFLDIICSGLFHAVPIPSGLLEKTKVNKQAFGKAQLHAISSQNTQMYFQENIEKTAA